MAHQEIPADIMELVDCRRPTFKPSASRVGWSALTKIPRLTARENVYGDHLNDKDRPILLCPEQKIEALLNMLMNSYTEHDVLVLGTFPELFEPVAPVCYYQHIEDAF